MTELKFESIKTRVCKCLTDKLDARLFYHNTHHTLDVLNQASVIASNEGIHNPEQLLLLKTAALYHDMGFLTTYAGHEAAGCEMASRELKAFGFTGEQVELICGMIMATKIPQSPGTHLQQVICDADLDYLGRDDFEKISDYLRREFLEFGITRDEREWEERQISFFETHRYFTLSSKQNRNDIKARHLLNLKEAFKKKYGL
ncbi:MAG TPA: HD domain-containing protein [Ferruginibacter sp.]|nr:HD domain-containing protein [Ferruginibacter sp.]